MTAGGCAEARTALGAYVLGALEPAERARVDAHVAECDACRDELASLAALPGLLGRVSVAEVELAPEPPGPELLDRLLAAVARERGRGRRVRWLASAAAAVVIAATGSLAGVALTSSSDATPAAAATVSATDPVTRVTASVDEWPKAWGVALQVKVTGVTPSAYIGKCQLVAVGADGTTEVAASWKPTESGHIVAPGATGFSASEIASFKVVTTEGSTLVSVPVNGAQS